MTTRVPVVRLGIGRAPWRRWLAVAALATVVLLWAGWRLTGGSVLTVATPSMGTTAPVGSLVLTRPLASQTPLRPGMLVVYRSAQTGGRSYLHRVSRVYPGGRFVAKGTLNRLADPWSQARSAIVGVPVAIIPVAGWLYRVLPWLLIAGSLLAFLATSSPARWRAVLAALWLPALAAVALLRGGPLVGEFVNGLGRHGGRIVARVINTGILPGRFAAPDGRPVLIGPGQERLVVGGAGAAHPLAIQMSAAVPWWLWPALVTVCLAPMAFAVRSAAAQRRLGAGALVG